MAQPPPYLYTEIAQPLEVSGDINLGEALIQIGDYSPLPIPLDRVESNFKVEAEASWPLRNLRLIRYVALADDLGPRIRPSPERQELWYIEKYGLRKSNCTEEALSPRPPWGRRLLTWGQ